MAILSTFECNNPKGFSKRDVYIQIYEEINRLFRMFDPYKDKRIFKFEEDESVIRGFLGLAEYFHTVVIKRKDEFFIPHASILFRLISA